jgi:hypothetical protein
LTNGCVAIATSLDNVDCFIYKQILFLTSTFLSGLKSTNDCLFLCFALVATGGLIPGSLTPPDKVVGAGDLTGHLLGQQQQQQHIHHQQQQQQQQQQSQQQHHNHYALALPAGSAMAPTLQTPPSPLSTPSPPVPIDRFGYVQILNTCTEQ